MAVYKKTYQRYEGSLTPEWSRFLVLPRYTFEEMWRSRFLTVFFLASFLVPVFFALTIYLHHNLAAIQLTKIDVSKIIAIDARFFMTFLGIQSMLAFFLAAFIGPGLISPDLANNALPLYLARPFSRAEYVIGKMSVLAILMSAMTWIPGLLLFVLQSYLEPDWMGSHLRIAFGLFVGSWIWILVLTLLALAISAWVKWKPIAAAMMFGVFFVAAGFGGAINGILRVRWGSLLNISALMGTVYNSLFGATGSGTVFFRVWRRAPVAPETAWTVLIGICLVCLWLLSKKVRGVEVVR